MITDAWRKVAERNGYTGSCAKLIEECGELSSATSELLEEFDDASRDAVIEECADVRACIDQVLWHLHGEAECEAISQWKCIRTLQRMREEER